MIEVRRIDVGGVMSVLCCDEYCDEWCDENCDEYCDEIAYAVCV